MTQNPISRRQLLAGIASGSAASVAGLALLTDRSRAYTNTMQIRTAEIDGLVLDWRETYNGATLTDTTAGTASASPSGPAISLGNVLPGDAGSLSVCLRLDTETAEENGTPAVAPEMTLSLGDDLRSPGIQEFIDTAVWYDTGLFGTDALGGNNAERDPGEELVHPDASGSLGEIGTALAEGISLDAAPDVPGTSCLGVEDAITVTFGWSFPPRQENINAAQGDTAEFDLRFDATRC